MIKDGVIQPHRVMFCTTDKGKEAMVRQLSAELHIDTSIDLARALHPFLSKLHLINTNEGTIEEAEGLVKSTNGKVLLFKSPSAYVSKLYKPVAKPQEATQEFIQPAVRMQPQGHS